MQQVICGHGTLSFDAEDIRPRGEFESRRPDAAWFCENRVGPRSKVLGVRLHDDLHCEVNGVVHVLPAGSILMKRDDGIMFGVPPKELMDSFSRSFSDGRALCRLADGPLEQALSLKNANRDISEQITQLESVSLLRSLFRGSDVKRRAAEVAARNAELQAHIRDLTRPGVAPGL